MEGQTGYTISGDELFFFNEKPAALHLYEAFVSFLPVRRAKERPETYITVSLRASGRISR